MTGASSQYDQKGHPARPQGVWTRRRTSQYVEEFRRQRTTLETFFINLIMDVQDFLVQGEGREEDKREAWELFQKAYQLQM